MVPEYENSLFGSAKVKMKRTRKKKIFFQAMFILFVLKKRKTEKKRKKSWRLLKVC